MAEREGFEPSIRGYRIHTFQACAFNHSATSPTDSKNIHTQYFIQLQKKNRLICQSHALIGPSKITYPLKRKLVKSWISSISVRTGSIFNFSLVSFIFSKVCFKTNIVDHGMSSKTDGTTELKPISQ